MKKVKRIFATILTTALVITLISSIGVFAQEGVLITSSGQVVDSITYNGVTVDAVYAPYNSIKNYGGDQTYCCAAFVKKFYSSVYGVEVYNLLRGKTPQISGRSGAFSLTTKPQIGDIFHVETSTVTHWAIVKDVDLSGGTVTLIQQNGWADNNRTKAAVGTTRSIYEENCTFYHYNAAGAGNSNDNVSVAVATNEAKEISETCATLYGSVSSSGTKINGVGMYIGVSRDNLSKLGGDTGSTYKTTMWYNTRKYGMTLSPGTTYYYQAYATATNGNTYWGEVKSFKTTEAPIKGGVDVSTDSVKDLTSTSATLYGSVSSKNGVRVTGVGMYLGTSSNKLSKLGGDTGNTTSTTMWYSTGKYGLILSPGTTYYYQAYATGSDGKTYWGEVKSFKTPEAPIKGGVDVSTDSVKDLTSTSATLYGTATPKDGARITGVGMYIGTSSNNLSKLAGDTGNTTSTTTMWYSTSKYGMTLSPGKTYYYQAYATDSNGNTYWGSVKSFTTPQETTTSNTRVGVISGTPGSLVINSKPKAGYNIGLIPEGASCTVYPDKTSGNWYWVSYNGVSGYAYNKYIKLK